MCKKIEQIITILNEYTSDVEYLEVDKYSFAEALVKAEGKISKYLNISENNLAKLTQRLFPGREQGKLLNFVLSLGSLKHCTRCSTYLPFSAFRPNRGNKDKLNSFCKECHCATTGETQAYRQACYYARKLQAIPGWANLEKIKEIYANCPIGYHVDHIFPLNGTNSCGLHVENNLQYLTAEENCRKKNKLPTLIKKDIS